MSIETNRIITGDSMEVLDDLEAESVHAVVCDPPYGLNFMSRSWDDFEPKEYQEWCEQWARKVKRVLKPGGHLLAFSGNRTHHRAFTGIEDAGFEIRDTITWHYGSGFPKASDISKTIDKRADAEREVLNTVEYESAMSGETYDAGNRSGKMSGTHEITAPATDAAKQWDGFKTALKPATEYVVVARKPFDGATADCVLEHGTGALNVNGCRINTDDELEYTVTNQRGGHVGGDNSQQSEPRSPEGRYPSNVVFDAQQADALDRANDTTKAGNGDGGGEGGIWSESVDGEPVSREYGDKGGVSRYFYTSKASKAERTLDGKIENAHPTVKPQDLMEWLVTLATAEGQAVLDPFAGSGTTCKAAKELGREFIGIERDPDHADIARVRCGLTPHDPSVVRDSDEQTGMEEWQ